jgi:hypothetical protein
VKSDEVGRLLRLRMSRLAHRFISLLRRQSGRIWSEADLDNGAQSKAVGRTHR